MKNKILKYTLFATVGLLLFGCEKNYEDPARITYFVDMSINGDEEVFTPTGVEYVDEGAVATESGVSVDVIVDNPVDNTTPGAYLVSYSAINSDGFAKTIARTVIVYDANMSTDDISGTYTGSVVRNGTEGYSDIPVTLTKVEGLDGIYVIDDWIAGFYAIGRGPARGYGPAYAFVGYIQINASNEVVLLDMYNVWGDPFDEVIGTYDPGSHTISYSAFWIGTYEFVVELVKN